MGTGILLVAEHLASTAACNEFEPQIDSSRNLVFLHSVRHSSIPGKVGRPMQMQFYFREVQPPSLQTFFVQKQRSSCQSSSDTVYIYNYNIRIDSRMLKLLLLEGKS